MPELTSIQTQVLNGLLSGNSVTAVAREHGIHRSTIYNWRHDHPHFSLALDKARARLETTLYDSTQDLAQRALDSLGELLDSPDANVKLRAIQIILRSARHAEPSVDSDPDGEARDVADGPESLESDPEFDTIRHNSTVISTSSPSPEAMTAAPATPDSNTSAAAAIRPASRSKPQWPPERK